MLLPMSYSRILIKAHYSDKLDQNLNVRGQIVPLALLKLLARLALFR